jgi:hypothetical protein
MKHVPLFSWHSLQPVLSLGDRGYVFAVNNGSACSSWRPVLINKLFVNVVFLCRCLHFPSKKLRPMCVISYISLQHCYDSYKINVLCIVQKSPPGGVSVGRSPETVHKWKYMQSRGLTLVFDLIRRILIAWLKRKIYVPRSLKRGRFNKDKFWKDQNYKVPSFGTRLEGIVFFILLFFFVSKIIKTLPIVFVCMYVG